jgi:hypothetical protein
MPDETGLLSAWGGFQRGSVPMWGTFALGLLAMILRFTPIWRKLSMTANDKLIGDIQADAALLRTEMAALKSEMSEVTARCASAEIRNSQLEFAVQMATDEIARIAPNSPVPAQIRRLLATSVPHPLPSGIAQQDMDAIRKGTAI